MSIKTMITIALVVFSAFGFYYKVMSDIEEAKQLPATGNGVYSVDPSGTWPPSRHEYKMKDELSRQGIIQLQKDLTELEEEVKELRRKVYGN